MNVGSGVSTWGRWDRPSIAALIAWGMALVVGAFIGDVSPMRGSAIALVGVVLVTPMLRAEARVAVVAVFGGLLLVPGHGSPFLWLLLVVAVILRWGDRVRLRVTWAAAGALCVFGVFPFLGNTTLGEMGAVALEYQ